MNDPPNEPPPEMPRSPGDPASCKHCGQPVALLNVLARLGDRPACRIFGCTACFQLEWIWETT